MRLGTTVAVLLLIAPDPAARAQSITPDSLRRELPLVIAVRRVPTGRDSVWVALVTPSGPESAALARFNRENPFFLTYLFENATSFDRHAFLAPLPGDAAAPSLFFERLAADTSFMRVLWTSLDGYLRSRAAGTAGAKSLYSADTLVLFASRFIHLETDTTGPVGFTLCAKSELLQDLPVPTSLALEAWMYSMVRPALQRGAFRETMAALGSVLDSAPHGQLSDARQAQLQHQMWDVVAGTQEFRRYVLAEIGRHSSYLPFGIKPESAR